MPSGFGTATSQTKLYYHYEETWIIGSTVYKYFSSDNSKTSLQGKVAVITGAGRGIGRAIAMRFANAGADIAICARTIDALKDTQQLVEQSGRRCLAGVADLADPISTSAFCQSVVNEFGKINILVNNAGAYLERGSVEESDPDLWWNTVEVNVRGPYMMTTQWALETSDILLEMGIDHSLLHVPTIKPANENEIVDFCFAHDEVITIENHNIVTGLGSLVTEVISNIGRGPRVTRLGIPDEWAPGGTLPYIRAQLGLDAASLARRIAECKQ